MIRLKIFWQRWFNFRLLAARTARKFQRISILFNTKRSTQSYRCTTRYSQCHFPPSIFSLYGLPTQPQTRYPAMARQLVVTHWSDGDPARLVWNSFQSLWACKTAFSPGEGSSICRESMLYKLLIGEKTLLDLSTESQPVLGIQKRSENRFTQKDISPERRHYLTVRITTLRSGREWAIETFWVASNTSVFAATGNETCQKTSRPGNHVL